MFEQPWNTSFIDFQCYPIKTSKQTRHTKWEKHTRCNPKRSENYLRSCWTCRVRGILKIIGLEWIILAEGSYTVYQFLSKPLTLPLRNPINFQERFDARWSVEKPKCFMINSTNYCFLKRFLSVTSVSWWRAFSRSRSKFVRVDNLRAWNKFEFFSLKNNQLPDLEMASLTCHKRKGMFYLAVGIPVFGNVQENFVRSNHIGRAIQRVW